MITRDHDGRDAGVPAGLHRRSRLGPRRIHHADEAKQCHAPFGVGDGSPHICVATARTRSPADAISLSTSRSRSRSDGVRSVSPDSRQPQAAVGQRSRRPRLSSRQRSPPHTRVTSSSGAVPNVNAISAVRGMLALERALIQTRLSAATTISAPSVGSPSTANGRPRAATRASDASTPARSRSQGLCRRGDRVIADAELADGFVADARDREQPSCRRNLPNRHLVLGQSAGLVGADHRRAAERLHNRQTADQRVPLHHAPARRSRARS